MGKCSDDQWKGVFLVSSRLPKLSDGMRVDTRRCRYDELRRVMLLLQQCSVYHGDVCSSVECYYLRSGPYHPLIVEVQRNVRPELFVYIYVCIPISLLYIRSRFPVVIRSHGILAITVVHCNGSISYSDIFTLGIVRREIA